MSSRAPNSSEMGAPQAFELKLEERLRQAAAEFSYPVTPDIAAYEKQRLSRIGNRGTVQRRSRLALGLALLFMVLLIVLMVSPVRARVLDWIRIGAVRIFFTQPTPSAMPLLPSGTPPPMITPTPTFLQSVLNLGGATTLSNAQQQVDFSIEMPAYPPDLGAPDHVFLQTFSSPVVVLVWMDENQPEKVRMSLSETASNKPVFEKYVERSIQDTQVDGNAAVWIEGDYLLVMRNGEATFTRLINQGHTLIWSTEAMTYRLETDADLETAIRIAQSIE